MHSGAERFFIAMFTVEQIKKLIAEDRVADFYNDKYWRRLSHDIILENHNECEYCRKRGKYSPARLVHHVKHMKKFPHLAYSRYYTDENGVRHKQLVALCQQCHEAEHPERRWGKHNANKFTNEERW